ncbi:hypothetical protein J4457_04530 [Candidatus Woesearchaeota archaeon]|nr:hypothetical protein [Candidatus Woesearchaeota archaeon]
MDFDELKAKALVVLPAGGKGTRLIELTHDQHHKSAHPANGKALIQYIIEMYVSAGFKRFLVLVGHHRESIDGLLEELRKEKGVFIDDCEDPFPHETDLSGKTAALYNAFTNGKIKHDDVVIIHNPDDLILSMQNFPLIVLANYVQLSKEVCVVGYQNGGALTPTMTQLMDGETAFFHFGITLGRAPFLSRFQSYQGVPDFEKRLFSELLQEQRLGFIKIPREVCYGVNTPEDYQRLVTRLHHG